MIKTMNTKFTPNCLYSHKISCPWDKGGKGKPHHYCGLKYTVWKPIGLYSFFLLQIKLWELIWGFKYFKCRIFTLIQNSVRALGYSMGDQGQVSSLFVLTFLKLGNAHQWYTWAVAWFWSSAKTWSVACIKSTWIWSLEFPKPAKTISIINNSLKEQVRDAPFSK